MKSPQLPPPVPKPVSPEEQVVQRECYPYFDRLWREITKSVAMATAMETVTRRTGIGAKFLSKALSYARVKSMEKIEHYANKLLECECLKEMRKAGP